MVTKQEEKLLNAIPAAPIFGLGKWREEHGLTGEEWASYSKAVAMKVIFYTVIAFFIGFEIGLYHAQGLI